MFYTYDEDAGQAAAEQAGPPLRRAESRAARPARSPLQSPDDGSIDYLDEQGRSLKKFLIRKPIADGIMRSGFGYRRLRSSATPSSIPASTGRIRSARRSSPPATAR